MVASDCARSRQDYGACGTTPVSSGCCIFAAIAPKSV